MVFRQSYFNYRAKTMNWEKTKELNSNYTKDGYLHHFNEEFEIRFMFRNGHDVWTLIYLPTDKYWTREGFYADETCKLIAESYLKYVNNKNKD